MAHMIWKGAISFGLVHVPVQLYPATQSEKVGFNLLDKRSIDPIGYKQINKRTGKEVARENIVRGFEYEKDKYVVLSDDEIRAANPESTQTVDILAFIDAPDISFLYLDTPYFLTPDRKGEKVYALLREAMKASGKIGVASVVLHNKQHLAALIPVGPMLALNTLRWAAEVRDFDEFKLPPEGMKAAGVTTRELDMAKKLINDMSDKWDPSQYHDTFHDDIMALVDRKIRAGKTEEITEVEAPRESRQSADILDLSDLLKRSLGRGKGKPATGARKHAADDDEEGDDADSGTAAPARKKPRAARSAATSRSGGKTSGASAKSAPAARKRRAAA
ncbi:Ku protein [Paraburkholderia nemoris]|uniref:non-homologous end joining protein Ku n=1 Tax=Paraburkholderia nemoris TaxID=2793076 RepID=UPI0006B67BB3|nr:MULTISPECIES: Ku protein [Paraburkholderia]KPD16576.1 DNA repair protein [Burkholderia sp. ST111]MBK3737633.1 Ku protein [Paraburkholderia aspalathi]MBK3781438.1 Ku protein [Paraburkholderia aspalathi]CAE6693542.1 Non-homologous end joining protein Ku [Paraburkholderia nemoris]CAE6704965.1 Non-homologous end joining protein Ku [Paraburkholderia nemoris]